MSSPRPAPGFLVLAARVAGYVRPHCTRLGGGLSLTALGIVLDLVKPLPLAIVLDTILGDKPPPPLLAAWFGGLGPRVQLGLAAAAILLLAVGRGLTMVGANYVTIDVGQRMVNDLRTALYAHLQKLSLRFHTRHQTGDLLFRVMADTYSIQGIVMNGVLPIASAAAMLGGMFAVMLRYDGALAVTALLVCPPLYVTIRRLQVRIHGHAVASKEAESDLYSRAATTIGAVKLVQAYGREERAVQEFRSGSERSLSLSLRLYGTETVFVLVVESLLAAGTAAIVWLGATRVLGGTLSIGELTIFLSYLRDLYQPIHSVSQNLAEISSARVGLDRVFSVLDIEPDIQDAPDAVTLSRVTGEIRLDNVNFAYEDGRPVLRDIDLRIAPGERIGLVGRTGAGKTTLAALILRFFDPQSGRVSMDGHDLRAVTLASLRHHVTLMLQDPILFHGTVFDNIAWGSREADPNRVREAARRAEAEPFILALPESYHTVIGEGGSTLSGGQRQRLALARALMRDAPIVILDEPTSSLDLATEARVWENVEEYFRGHTAIVIAHRLSTARRAGRIVVLEDGTIAEQGSHDELLARRGVYFDLWQRHGGEEAEAMTSAGRE